MTVLTEFSPVCSQHRSPPLCQSIKVLPFVVDVMACSTVVAARTSSFCNVIPFFFQWWISCFETVKHLYFCFSKQNHSSFFKLFYICYLLISKSASCLIGFLFVAYSYKLHADCRFICFLTECYYLHYLHFALNRNDRLLHAHNII